MKLDAEAQAAAKKMDAAAQAERIKQEGVAQAEITEKQGLAQAEAVKQLGLAEAEALEKKAEALAKMNDAGKLQMVIEKLPEIARAVAEPMAKIGNITIIGGGSENGDGAGAADVARYTVGAPGPPATSIWIWTSPGTNRKAPRTLRKNKRVSVPNAPLPRQGGVFRFAQRGGGVRARGKVFIDICRILRYNN